MDRDRSISRVGNPRAPTTLILLAWLWLRYQPASAFAAWFRERVGTLQGRTRRIAIVAMARKLLIALWRYVETGVTLATVPVVWTASGENKLRLVAGCWFHDSPKSNSSCLAAGCCEACGQPPTLWARWGKRVAFSPACP
jgi:hypothetical protein